MRKAKATRSVEKPDNSTLEVKGHLRLIEQAGEVSIQIDGEPLDVLIARQFGGAVINNVGLNVSGRFVVTVHRIK